MTERHLKIFVVEDSEWYNRLLVHTLTLNPDHEVKSFFTGKELLDSLNQSPDVVTLDFRLPDISGLEVLKQIREFNSDIQVILISEQEDIDMVVTLLKHGAYDYITKTDDIRDRLLNTIQNIKNGIGLKRELTNLRREVQKKYSFRDSIIGESKAIREIFELIEKAVTTNITVVLSG